MLGKAQNVVYAAAIPAVATVKAASPAAPETPGIAESENATAPINPAIATCQQRSPVLSEWCPTATIAIAAAPQGIIVSSPIMKGSLLIVSFKTCGRKKLSP